MTSVARQEKDDKSKFKRCKLWEKSIMESIQSPKLRTHCVRCKTTPLQKISLSVSGFDLNEINEFLVTSHSTIKILNLLSYELTCTCKLAEVWRARQMLTQEEALGPPYRRHWIQGCFQPTSWSHPLTLLAGHRIAVCHWHPPSQTIQILIPDTRQRPKIQYIN